MHMIGDKCAGLNNIIKELVILFPNTFDFNGKDICFELNTKL